jgi:hypothetical protein
VTGPRLADEVVCAHLEAEQLVNFFVFGGKEDHRYVRRLAQATQDLHAIHARHFDIQDGEIRWTQFEAVKRGGTIRIAHYPISLGFKR